MFGQKLTSKASRLRLPWRKMRGVNLVRERSTSVLLVWICVNLVPLRAASAPPGVIMPSAEQSDASNEKAVKFVECEPDIVETGLVEDLGEW